MLPSKNIKPFFKNTEDKKRARPVTSPLGTNADGFFNNLLTMSFLFLRTARATSIGFLLSVTANSGEGWALRMTAARLQVASERNRRLLRLTAKIETSCY
jgi:hypothetical protein